MRTISAIVLLFAFVTLATGKESDDARLLVSKNILNELLVEHKDLTIKYDIYNVGGSAALNVNLKDSSFPTSDFDIVHGSLDVTWPRIAPGTNISHLVIVKPLQSGYANFTAAEITYLASEDAKELTAGYTSAPGEGGILQYKDYDRKFSPHVLDWGAFVVMTVPSLGIPFLLWCSSKSKYEQGKIKKN